MPRSVTPPPDVVDAFSAQGDLAFGHATEVAEAYRAVTADARQRQLSGLPPAGSPVASQPAAPSGPQLPYVGPARAALGNELALLRGKAADRERWLNSSQIGMGGMPMSQVPGYGTQRQAVMDELAAIREAISRLEAVAQDDQATRQWAFDRGVR